MQADERKVLELLNAVLKNPEAKVVTREYLLNCLIKLSAKFKQPESLK